MGKKSISKNYALQVILSVLLGSLTGWLLGARVSFLGELGLLLIKFLKALATPLVFLAIVDAFCKTQIQAKSGIRLVGISLTNALVAAGIALSLSLIFPFDPQLSLKEWESLGGKSAHSLPPGPALPANPPQSSVSGLESSGLHFDFGKVLQGFVPASWVEPFLKNEVIPVIFLAILMGMAIRHLKSRSEHTQEIEVLERGVSGGLQVIVSILHWVTRLIPIAIFGVLAKLVGQSGLGVFLTLGAFVLRVAVGMGIQCLIYYPLLLWGVGKISPIRFFKNAIEALATAFGTGSSLATLPVTLRTLQEKMKVSPESARLAACVGTNLNHDGILLYEATTALMVAQIYGAHLGFSGKAVVLGVSALAAVGIAGIPDAGLVTLSLVLSAAGLPLTLIPVLMSVDWLIGRLRATTNVTSDLVVANLLDRLKT